MANISKELKETLASFPNIKEVFFVNQTDYFFNYQEVDGDKLCNGKLIKESLKRDDILKAKANE